MQFKQKAEVNTEDGKTILREWTVDVSKAPLAHKTKREVGLFLSKKPWWVLIEHGGAGMLELHTASAVDHEGKLFPLGYGECKGGCFGLYGVVLHRINKNQPFLAKAKKEYVDRYIVSTKTDTFIRMPMFVTVQHRTVPSVAVFLHASFWNLLSIPMEHVYSPEFDNYTPLCLSATSSHYTAVDIVDTRALPYILLSVMIADVSAMDDKFAKEIRANRRVIHNIYNTGTQESKEFHTLYNRVMAAHPDK